MSRGFFVAGSSLSFMKRIEQFLTTCDYSVSCLVPSSEYFIRICSGCCVRVVTFELGLSDFTVSWLVAFQEPTKPIWFMFCSDDDNMALQIRIQEFGQSWKMQKIWSSKLTFSRKHLFRPQNQKWWGHVLLDPCPALCAPLGKAPSTLQAMPRMMWTNGARSHSACCIMCCLACVMWTELLFQQGVVRPNLLRLSALRRMRRTTQKNDWDHFPMRVEKAACVGQSKAVSSSKGR